MLFKFLVSFCFLTTLINSADLSQNENSLHPRLPDFPEFTSSVNYGNAPWYLQTFYGQAELDENEKNYPTKSVADDNEALNQGDTLMPVPFAAP